jgi:Amt family ammonium transporter
VTAVASPLLASGALLAPGINSGDTAWMFAATALVLMMTPALGLFYAGLVRAKNTLNTFMMSIGALGVVTVAWALLGYSLAFDKGNGVIGGLHLALLRFGPFLVFMVVWSLAVYAVLAHWVFGGGWLQAHGTLDFAGGVPVEMGSGFSTFAAATVVGALKDYGRQAVLPHNAIYVLLGAGLLWFEWFGFNGGSGLSTGHSSVLASTNTLLAPACTLVVWFVLYLVGGGRVTAIGAATAIIVGCVAITPASGYVSPIWAMALGGLAALPSYAFIVWRPRTRIDETLDVLAAPACAFVATYVILRVLDAIMPLRAVESRARARRRAQPRARQLSDRPP